MSTNDGGTGSKKTWDDWSDFDLSFAVAKLVAIDGLVEHNSKAVHIHDYHNGVCLGWKTFSINNPADMWPIMFENKIGLQPDPFKDGVWFSYDADDLNIAESTKPLRAAAIVFLEMNGVKPNV